MKLNLTSILALLMALLLAVPALAKEAVLKDARLWAGPDNTRVVFDISAPVEHSLFTLKNPGRIVIDVSNASVGKLMKSMSHSKGVVKAIRTATRKKTDVRIVLDLKHDVKMKSFLLKPHQNYGHRLVLDLENKSKAKVIKTVKTTNKNQRRDLIIAIDAGHGGEDPGASGYRGTKEKDVVMAIARRLERLITAQRGMRPVMIRTGDYYIGLRKRVEIARKNKADMYISIHADAFKDKRARGASVYALSQHGATTEAARWLAESENSSDYIGGVSLEDKDDLLTSVLLDLSMNGKVEASLELGDYVLSELRGIGRVHKRKVGQAGFVVLKAPDTPSILVETAFISNPKEEKKLLDSRHQTRMAKSILRGINRYFVHNSIPGTLLAQRQHVISKGENLGVIANKYQISAQALRKHNSLSSNNIKVGDVLVIPGS